MVKQKFFRCVNVILSAAMVMMPVRGYSLPEGETVVSGSATFDRAAANILTVNQATDSLIANYDSFSIAQTEAVNFNQPSAQSVALNRVVGVDPSAILGTLTANGRVFLVNPNGIVFGQGCSVDTAGMVASTLNIADSDFLAGRYTFINAGGSVVNQGYISSPGGYVALLGSSIDNTGVIEANLGTIALASGNAITLNLDPQGLISVVIDEETISNPDGKDAAVKNSGTLKADGGKVVLTAKTLDGIFDKAVNTEGIIEAHTIGDVTGQVTIDANQRVDVAGAIEADGGSVRVDSFSDIYVTDDLSVTGNFEFVADADDNGTGEFGLYAGKTLSSGGTLSITAGDNIWFGDNSIVTANGPITLFAGESIIQYYNSVIKGTRRAAFVPGSLDSDLSPNQWYNHDDDGYSDTNKPVVDFTWEYYLDPSTSLPALTATAVNGNYEMYSGSSVNTNGGTIEIHADKGWLHINSGGTYRGFLNAGAGEIHLYLGKNLVVNDLSFPTFRAGEGSAGVFITVDNNDSKNVKAAAFSDGSSDPIHLAFDISFKLGDIDGLLGPITVRDQTSDTTGLCGVEATATQEGDAWDFTISIGSLEIASISNFMFDWTAPEIQVAVLGNDDNLATTHSNGEWYNDVGGVTYTYSAINTGISGLDVAASDLTSDAFTSEVMGAIASAYAQDNAGNSVSFSDSVNTDWTAPVITAQRDTAANAAGWNNGDVASSYSATDALSGLVDPATGTYMFTAEGADQSHTFTVYDLAGNFASATVSDIDIDLTAPVITAGSPSGTPGSGDTWASDVTVPFSATDSLSGFAPDGASNIDLASKTTSGEGSGLLVTSDGISDLAGNFAAGIIAGPFTVAYPRLASEAPFTDDGSKYFRAYYEILENYRFVSNEPATPTTFYAYHPPLRIDDSKVLDDIVIDWDAYDFINNNVNLKSPLAPYFNENEDLKKKKKI